MNLKSHYLNLNPSNLFKISMVLIIAFGLIITLSGCSDSSTQHNSSTSTSSSSKPSAQKPIKGKVVDKTVQQPK